MPSSDYQQIHCISHKQTDAHYQMCYLPPVQSIKIYWTFFQTFVQTFVITVVCASGTCMFVHIYSKSLTASDHDMRFTLELTLKAS